MPDKKLTDNEIIKALEEWIKNYDGSYVNFKILGNVLDLINCLKADKEYYKKNRDRYQDNVMFLSKQCDELQAEIERLKNAYKQCAFERDAYIEIENTAIAEAKAEAYKECLTKANEIIAEFYNKHIFGNNDLEAEEKDAIINFSDDITYRLNNLLKEMVGEHNA